MTNEMGVILAEISKVRDNTKSRHMGALRAGLFSPSASRLLVAARSEYLPSRS